MIFALPTNSTKKIDEMHIELPIDLLAQSAALFCPNATYLHDLYIHPSNVMQTIILWRIAVRSGRDGTLGQTYKSAPTVGYHKFSGASGQVSAERYFREGMWGC